MCDIISINKNGDFSEEDFEKVYEVIFQKQEKNEDGSSVMATNYNNRGFKLIRKKRLKLETIEWLLKNFDVINFHFRIATSGEVDYRNYHFWSRKGWFFAHNGTSHSDKIKDNDYCDSFYLFNRMINKNILKENGFIDIEKSEEILSDVWGRMLAFNKKIKRNYYFGNWKTYNLNKHLIISSSRLESSIRQTETFGLKFGFDSERISNQTKDIKGVHYLDLKSKRVNQLLEEVKYYYNKKDYDWEKDSYDTDENHIMGTDDEEKDTKKFDSSKDNKNLSKKNRKELLIQAYQDMTDEEISNLEAITNGDFVKRNRNGTLERLSQEELEKRVNQHLLNSM